MGHVVQIKLETPPEGWHDSAEESPLRFQCADGSFFLTDEELLDAQRMGCRFQVVRRIQERELPGALLAAARRRRDRLAARGRAAGGAGAAARGGAGDRRRRGPLPRPQPDRARRRLRARPRGRPAPLRLAGRADRDPRRAARGPGALPRAARGVRGSERAGRAVARLGGLEALRARHRAAALRRARHRRALQRGLGLERGRDGRAALRAGPLAARDRADGLRPLHGPGRPRAAPVEAAVPAPPGSRRAVAVARRRGRGLRRRRRRSLAHARALLRRRRAAAALLLHRLQPARLPARRADPRDRSAAPGRVHGAGRGAQRRARVVERAAALRAAHHPPHQRGRALHRRLDHRGRPAALGGPQVGPRPRSTAARPASGW